MIERKEGCAESGHQIGMNRKYFVEKDGKTLFFIVDGQKDLQEELEKLFGIEKGYGLSVELWQDRIEIRNYFRADTVATFPVLKVEDTAQAPCYRLTEAELI